MGLNSENNAGSVWHRWDPHLHAPGTLRNDQFAGNWAEYFSAIEAQAPKIDEIRITDYFRIRTYKKAIALRASGKRLPDVKLIFPNVEMRLDLRTEKQRAINIHLLFSPDDPNHVSEIERVLSRLEFDVHDRPRRCTEQEL